MKLKVLCNFLTFLAVALFSYSAARAQVVDAVKKAADKTKDVTVEAAKKTAEVTKDAAVKTKNGTVDAAKKTDSGAKRVESYTVKIIDNVKGPSYEGGRWLVVSTWNGTKWVSKRTWFETKKASTATKNAVVGNDKEKQP